jgi:hypothetical protein
VPEHYKPFMKKYILIKLFIFLLPVTFWGQNDLISESTKDTENFISKLRTAKIDTILVYKEYCTGCEITSITKEPMYEEGFINTYIIWLNNGKAFTKKFSYPNIDEKEHQINISDILNFFYEHKKQFNSKKEYFKKGRFLPPNPVHDHYEELIIMTQNDKELITLSENQKTKDLWLKFSWIPPSKKIMELIRNKLN